MARRFKKNRVVVTGLGVVSPAGNNPNSFWEAISQGHSAVKHIARFDASKFNCQIAAEVDNNFDENQIIPSELKAMTDLFSQFALVSTINAVENSGLTKKELKKSRCGVIIGTAAGGLSFAEKELRKKRNQLHPHTVFAIFPINPAVLVSKYFGLTAPITAISTACSATSDAIGLAYQRIKEGKTNVMVAGGADSNIEPITFYSLSLLRIMSKSNRFPIKACKPFDKHRDGLVLGEGAATLVLENYEHALARGAKIYAEILGWGFSLDAYHITAREPSGDQALRAVKIALDRARLDPKDIQYISAHGTATKNNDVVETKFIKKIFKDHAYNLLISSIKPVVGHGMGAASAMQAVANTLIFNRNLVPPTINYTTPDPDCDLNYVPSKPVKKRVDYILQNSAGFAGINSVLVLGRVV